MAFLIWRGVLLVVSAAIRLLGCMNANALKNGVSPTFADPNPVHTSTPTLSPAPTSHVLPNRMPDSVRPSGRDSSSEQSELPSRGPIMGPTVSSAQPRIHPTTSSVCQDHLLIMDKYDGLDVSPKHCPVKRCKPERLLNADWFYQNASRFPLQGR